MKHIQVPFEVVTVKPWATILEQLPDAKPEAITFLRWATFMWLDDPRGFTSDTGAQSIIKMRRWQKVIDKFEVAKPGQYISLDDDDYETLKKIVESPARVFQQNTTQVTLSCLLYVDAVLNAVSELPVVATA